MRQARVTVRGRRLQRRCFVGDVRRLLLPVFGSHTGGLDVFDPAIAGLFGSVFAPRCRASEACTLSHQRLDRSHVFGSVRVGRDRVLAGGR